MSKAAIILGTIDYDAGPQRVQIDICQAVDQRFIFVDDHAFEPVPPKISPAVVKPVVVPGKANLDFPHELRKA